MGCSSRSCSGWTCRDGRERDPVQQKGKYRNSLKTQTIFMSADQSSMFQVAIVTSHKNG